MPLTLRTYCRAAGGSPRPSRSAPKLWRAWMFSTCPRVWRSGLPSEENGRAASLGEAPLAGMLAVCSALSASGPPELGLRAARRRRDRPPTASLLPCPFFSCFCSRRSLSSRSRVDFPIVWRWPSSSSRPVCSCRSAQKRRHRSRVARSERLQLARPLRFAAALARLEILVGPVEEIARGVVGRARRRRRKIFKVRTSRSARCRRPVDPRGEVIGVAAGRFRQDHRGRRRRPGRQRRSSGRRSAPSRALFSASTHPRPGGRSGR